MAPFPSPRERMVASALLLLATTPPKFRLDDDDDEDCQSMMRVQRNEYKRWRATPFSGDSSKSCSSLITTTSEASTEEIRARKLRVIALAALRRGMKLKGVRRSRSKTQTSWKAFSGSSSTTASFGSVITTAESSCVSSSSSAASSARSRNSHVSSYRSAWNIYESNVSMAREEALKRKRLIWTAHMRRQGEAILTLLSGGCCFSEVSIRHVVGDSPDTSKALRMLLKLSKVKRSGSGGRHCPYIYTIA